MKNIYKQLEFVDIRNVLDDLNIEYNEAGKNIGNEWLGIEICPFCQSTNNHLGININSPVFSCFACGEKGNTLKYLVKELNSYPKAIQILEKHLPLEFKKQNKKIKNNNINVKLPTSNKNPSIYQKNYLINRDFNPDELIEKYDLYFCGPTGKWANRIIVPIFKNRMLITFTSIDIHKGSKMRYKHLSEEKSIIPIKKHLFGLENQRDSVIVVEGIFDKFRIGTNCVCSFGTQQTQDQTAILSEFKRVIIAFDGDKAGNIAMNRLGANLATLSEVIQVTLPTGKDPDMLSNKEVKEIRSLL